MAKTDFKTINEYHKTFPKEMQERMQVIRAIIRKAAPGADEVISYQIPAFKIGRHYLIYYAGFAKHISLANPWSAALLKEFSKELKDFKVSKSVIQFPNDKPLPADFIKRVIKFRITEVEQKIKLSPKS